MLKVIQISITMLPDVHQSIIVPLRQNLMWVESCDVENILVFLNSALISWVTLIQFFLSHRIIQFAHFRSLASGPQKITL